MRKSRILRKVAGPKGGYRWTKTDRSTTVRVIRRIDQQPMKLDVFNRVKGKPTRRIGVAGRSPLTEADG